MSKKFDLVVRVGSYQSNGVEKPRWKTIGSVMDDGKGGQYMFIDATFNPAGVPRKENSESIIVSCFEPKDRAQSQPAPEAPQQAIEEPKEIPF